MYREYDAVTGIYGFGRSKGDAEEDLIRNIAREDIGLDKSGVYSKRRQELHPWLPLPTLLQVTGICCIVYENGYLRNTRTNKSVKPVFEPLSHYLTLFQVFDGLITFDDFTICMAPEVNKFMKNIYAESGLMKTFPIIKPGNLDYAMAIHYVNDTLSVSECSNNTFAVISNFDVFEVDIAKGVDMNCLLAYAFARAGYLYNGKEITKI